MNKRIFWWVGLALLTASAGCKRHRLAKQQAQDTTAIQQVVVARPDSSQVVVKPTPQPPKEEEIKLNVEEIDFKYLSSRSKVSFKSKDQDLDNANVSIRLKKDSVLWFNVRVAVLDVARGMLTRDTVIITDNYHRDYYCYNYASLSKKFGVALNFDLLQSLIVGNMPIKKRPKDKISKEPDFFLLQQNEGKIMLDNYIGEQNRKLKRFKVTEPETNNTLRMEYEEFNALNNFLFPYSSLITVDYQSKTDSKTYQTLIQIKHQKVELLDEPLSFPFTIPANYERKN
jgi:hypothetical protein